jgi:hypothetical protein
MSTFALQPADLTPPWSRSGLGSRPSTASSSQTAEPNTPPFSPTSATPVLEKDDAELDFHGNVDVNDELPTERDLKRAGDLLLLDSKGQSRPFKDLYTREGIAPRQLIIFIRHFFCGVSDYSEAKVLHPVAQPDSLRHLELPGVPANIICVHNTGVAARAAHPNLHNRHRLR